MGLLKDEKWRRVMRIVKTVLFLIYMIASLLLFSAPVLLAIADALIPSALLSTFNPSLSLHSLSSHLQNYDFRSSLVDIPLISLLRSALIVCIYSLCDGPTLSKWPYVGITMACSAASLAFVSLKASYVFVFGFGFGFGGGEDTRRRGAEMALFLSSVALAVAHAVVAYRTSCRERRKLLVFKIDIEAVRVCASKNGFPRYQEILQQERVK